MKRALLAGAAALALSLAPATAQLGGESIGGLGASEGAAPSDGGSYSIGGIDPAAIARGGAIPGLRAVTRNLSCGGALDGMVTGGASALATTFSGGGYPTMDIGSIIRLMATLAQMEQQTGIQCGIRLDASTLSGMASVAGSGWRSIMPEGSSIDGLLNGAGGGGMLAGLYERFIGRDRVYEGEDIGFDHREQVRRGRAVSGAMAAQQAVYDEIHERTEIARGIEEAGRSATTASEKQDAANRYREEQTKIQALQTRLTMLNGRARMEETNFEQRRAENRRMEMDLALLSLMAARGSRLTGLSPTGAQMVTAVAQRAVMGGMP